MTQIYTKEDLKNKQKEIYDRFIDNRNICHCPYDSIEYLISVDNDQAVNIKTGKCLRCGGVRLNSIGKVLKSKKYSPKSSDKLAGKKDINNCKEVISKYNGKCNNRQLG